MRYGFTTGSCAAAAAKAAAYMLLTGKLKREISIETPKGIPYTAKLVDISRKERVVCCAVEKDGGDDPDITTGAFIYAKVSFGENDAGTDTGTGKGAVIKIDGGKGVGRVTKPGLDQPVGNAAINHVPREMIEKEVMQVCQLADYKGCLQVEISVPDGEMLAQQTFNPRLGIVGGISILGTTGIVEPMSNQALIDTIEVEIKQAAETADRVILTPGNYGNDYINSIGMDTGGIPVIRISNFLGEAIDIAVSMGFREILLISHIGKLVKVAAGVMMTHSRYADCRKEVFCSHSAVAGAEQSVCKALMEAATTDGCLEILDKAGLREEIMGSVLKAVQANIQRRAGEEILIGAVTFSNVYGRLGETDEAGVLIRKWNVGNITA